jgi:hypothetical protein
MFYTIFIHELKYRLSNRSTWITCAVLFLFWFFATMKLGQDPKLWGANGEVYFNAPLIIYILLAVKGFVAYIALPLLMADPLHRDLSTNTGAWLYALPIHEQSYFWGRFLGSFTSLALIIVIASLSMLLAPHAAIALNMVEAERVLTFPLAYLLDGYIKILLPTIFMSAAIVFSSVVLTRKYAAALIATIVLFLGSIIAVQISHYGRYDWFQLINPTAFHAVHDSTLFWDVEQRNTAFIPFSGMLLYNRVLWVGIGLSLLVYTSFRFRFTCYLAGNERPQKPNIDEPAPIKTATHLTTSHRSSSLWSQVRLLFDQAIFELTTILKEPLFIAIFALCATWVIVNNMSWQNLQFDSLLPSTSAMINSKRALWMLTFISLPFMAGTLIYRERSVGIDAIVDSSPAPDWVFYGSKLLALSALTLLFPTLVIIGGITTQLLGGYYNIDISLYLTNLYLIYFPHLLQISFFVFGICVLVNDRIKGFSLSVLLLYFSIFGAESGAFQHEMLLQLYETKHTYSAFFGYGAQAVKLFWYNLYWLSVSAIVVYLATLFWNRGSNVSFTERLRLAKYRLTQKSALVGLSIAGVTLFSSGIIIHNQHDLNDYLTQEQQHVRQAEYEKLYQKLALLPIPSIGHAKIQLELYPKQRRADYTATLQINNTDARPIDTLYLMSREHLTINTIEVNGLTIKAQKIDSTYQYSSYRLPIPLSTGESIDLTLNATLKYTGFTNGRLPKDLVVNGSFLTESLLPRFNYDPTQELSREHDRNEQKLPQRLPLDSPKDIFDWDITIGTVAKQTAIAPGRLNRQWEKNGRNYAQFISTAKDQNRLAFLSANYEVEHSTWQGSNQKTPVKIEVYSHPQHQANVNHITKASKRALTFLSKYFGPYPYPELRIAETSTVIEDPQTYAGLILIPENKVWNGDYQNEHGQMPTFADYTITRAIAKHWWAHQLAHGNVSDMIAEAIPEYLAHRTIENTYGSQLLAEKYIQHTMRRYFFFRAPQSESEATIVPDRKNDEYVYHLKAALALNALAHVIGAEDLNSLLGDFYQINLAKNISTLTADDLYQYLLQQLPAEDTPLLTEYFTQIIDYNQHIEYAEYTPIADGHYRVKLKAYRSQHISKQTPNNKNTIIPIEIAIYSKTANKQNQIKSYLWDGGKEEIEIVVDEKPVYAIIDPSKIFLDSNQKNNRVRMKHKQSSDISSKDNEKY